VAKIVECSFKILLEFEIARTQLSIQSQPDGYFEVDGEAGQKSQASKEDVQNASEMNYAFLGERQKLSENFSGFN
jgi:hypothetical protein